MAESSMKMATSQEVVSLRDYFESHIAAAKKSERDYVDFHIRAHEKSEYDYRIYLDQRFEGLDKAVGLANSQLEKRLDLLNEFRAQSQDEQDKFAKKEVVNTRLDSVCERLSKAEQWQAVVDGKFTMMSIVWGILVVVINVAMRFFMQDVV